MPLTKLVADALGVVTISLVALLVLLGIICILYSFYFRDHIRSQGYTQLQYFSGPWIIRIIFILFTILCCFGEILRLEFLRHNGRVLHILDTKWQQTICKCYIVSNLGFSEPCLFLTLVFLLRASLQTSGTLSNKWNLKTAIYVLLCCLPILSLQMTVILVGPQYETDVSFSKRGYFFQTSFKYQNDMKNITRCHYPLLSTIFLGVFVFVLTLYLFWLGRRILSSVINKGLRKRVYTLIFFVSSFFTLRVVLLGLSVLFKPGDAGFEVIAFLAFLCLLCGAGVGICTLVYFPIADSLALRNLQDMEDTRRIIEEHNETLSLIANNSARDSVGSTKRGSISFRTGETRFVELSLFSPSQHVSPVGSPEVRGWPMVVGGG